MDSRITIKYGGKTDQKQKFIYTFVTVKKGLITNQFLLLREEMEMEIKILNNQVYRKVII